MVATVAAFLVVGGCGGGSGSASRSPATTDLSVRVLPAISRSGSCTDSPVGAGTTVVVKDDADDVLGSATAAISPGAEGCDVTADIADVTAETSYVLETGQGRQLATVEAAQIVDGQVTLKIAQDGTVTVVD